MIKFEYHYRDKTLFIQTPGETPRQIESTFTTNWGSPGFVLEPINHWITFTVWPNKIRVFYKQVIIPSQASLWELEQITYYQKDLPKEEVISFTFAPQDQVHKVDGLWVKKNHD
jgi:hypothetical protein